MTCRVAAWLCVLSVSLTAWAGETAKVSVNAEVVVASMKGSQVEPASLADLKTKLAPKAAYTSLKRFSMAKVTLPAEVKLPNEKLAKLSLEELKEGVAKVRVVISPLSTVYSLGREGSLVLEAGKSGEEDVWLVLSAAK